MRSLAFWRSRAERSRSPSLKAWHFGLVELVETAAFNLLTEDRSTCQCPDHAKTSTPFSILSSILRLPFFNLTHRQQHRRLNRFADFAANVAFAVEALG